MISPRSARRTRSENMILGRNFIPIAFVTFVIFMVKNSVARGFAVFVSCSVLCALLAGCRQDMHDQPKYEALEASSFFKDGRSSRPLVAGTVARGHLNEDPALNAG